MRFLVGAFAAPAAEPMCVLAKDGWNDWFKWYTLYSAKIVMPNGQVVELGRVKIARQGMTEQQGSTELPPQFEALEPTFFSLGQDENYYETLITLGAVTREAFLTGIRDCAFDLDLFEANTG